MSPLAKDVPRRVVDENASTLSDLVRETGESEYWVKQFARKSVEDGRWERVWKHQGGKLTPAYRRKKS